MSELLATFKEIKANITSLREASKKIARATFEEGTTALFAAHPSLQRISWVQYTPYFNDGDPCTFSAHAGYADINNPYDRDDEDDDEEGVEYPKATAEALDAVHEFLGVFDDDDYLDLFDDGFKVIITREDGIRVEEYNHD